MPQNTKKTQIAFCDLSLFKQIRHASRRKTAPPLTTPLLDQVKKNAIKILPSTRPCILSSNLSK